ncbi:MAG: hypothetical protein MK116_00345 [Phycisphaerales bacterium]|nr:hypothetical protein [Phycisphaerales bacterium]
MHHTLRTAAGTAGWGLFLTSSWTWCIGMWLPTILIARFGWPGFWLFLIPNVVGCTAMGYVIRTRESSLAMVDRHRGPMRWFSVATVAYQLFFLSYIFGLHGDWLGLGEGSLGALVIPLAALGLAVLASALPWITWPWVGTAVFLATGITWLILGNGVAGQIAWTGNEPPVELWPAAPLIILGFLACPWLDPTFHRARQLAPNRHAFGVFGLTFLGVLLFVTTYCDLERGVLEMLGPLILAFFLYQAIFTMAVHLREIRLLAAPGAWGSTGLLTVVSLVGIVIGYSIWLICCADIASSWLADTYLRFLALYGLVFPAWILMFMLARTRLDARSITILCAALLLGFPFAEYGMIHGSHWWLLPPVAFVLLAPALSTTLQSRPTT